MTIGAAERRRSPPARGDKRRYRLHLHKGERSEGLSLVRLYLVRHGESVANRDGVYAGDTDVPLTPLGEEQAQSLARRLAPYPLDLIVTSDLERARKTAEAIGAGRSAEVVVDPRLRECDFGRWEGRSYDQIRAEEPEALARWLEGGDEAAPPGGETWGALCARVMAAWDAWRGKVGRGAVAFVTHTGPIRALLCRLFHLPRPQVRRFHVATASVTVVDHYPPAPVPGDPFPGGPFLMVLNDTGHLHALGGLSPFRDAPVGRNS